MANEIGSAYLIVLPQLDSDFESALTSLVGGVGDIPVVLTPEVNADVGAAVGEQVDKSSDDIAAEGSAIGALLGDGITAGIGIAVAGLAAGAGLAALGEQFDKAKNVLRAGTGEVGEDLKGLDDIAKDIFSRSPAAISDISGVVALAHSRLGLVGDDLNTVATRIVQLARVTGTDLPTLTDDVTGMFNLWHVGAGDQEGDLDKLLRVSQKTGIGVTDLTGQLNGAGLQLQSLGFSFDDSISLIGNLNKNGLDLSVTTAAFRKALTLAAKEGKPANEVFRNIFDSIKNAPDDTAAAGIAVENFGARGVTMSKAIRDGQFAWEDLSASIQDGDTIKGAAGDVATFASKFEILKHKAELAFEPIGVGIADALTGFGSFAGDVWDTFQNEGWDAAWDKITNKADQIWDGDPTTGSEGIHQKLNRFLEGLPGWGVEAGGKLLDAGHQLFDAAVKWAEDLWNGDPATGREGLSTKLDRMIDEVPPWVAEKAVVVRDNALQLLDALIQWADNVWEGDPATGKEGLHQKLNRLTDPDGPFLTWVSEQPGRIADKFKEWGPAVVKWAADIWDGDKEAGTPGLHQHFDGAIDKLNTWIDEQSGEKLASIGEKLIGAMVVGSLIALNAAVNIWRQWTLTAARILFIDLIPGFFRLGWHLGQAILKGLAAGFVDLPGPAKAFLETQPGIGALFGALDAIGQIDEHGTEEHAAGGIVGGPLGRPKRVIAHGGERVLTTEQTRAFDNAFLRTGATQADSGFTLVQHIAGGEPERVAQKTVTAMREEFLTRGTGR